MEEAKKEGFRYLETVRDKQPAKYREFLRVLNDHGNQRIGTAEVASRVKALFWDSPGLVAGFNAFLPEEHQIEVAVDELNAGLVRDVSSNPQDREKRLEVARRYVETVRGALEEDDPDKLHEFQDILADFMNHRIGVTEVASRVKTLFRDSPGLLAGFDAFLPEWYKNQSRC